MFHYNFSTINYDAINGSVFGSMRLGWNQGMMHSCVYPSLFCYPTMNYGSFSPYQQTMSTNWLLDPGYALQMTFAGLQNCGFFGNGWTNIQTTWPTSGVKTTTSKTEEEKAQEEKLNNLTSIAKEVVKKLPDETKSTLQTAIDKKDGTITERITALEEALKADSVKTELERTLFNPPASIKIGSKKLSEILKELGLNSGISASKITDMNALCNKEDGISANEVTLLYINKTNVLEYINGLESFDLINEKNVELYNDLKDALKTLAQEIENNDEIDSTLKSKIAEYRAKFIGEDSNPTLEDFKNLYSVTLLAVSKLAYKKLKDGYGDDFSQIIDNNFYTNKAKEILNKKGITAETISS